MSQRIDLDHRRFRQIIRGKIKQNLRKYISHGEMVARKGKNAVSIPLPSVDIPHFVFGEKQQGGVAQGDGDVGDVLGQGDVQPGAGEAGDRPGEHLVEVEVSLDELAEILGEELALPRIEPKGSEKIVAWKDKYTGIRRTGPESLRHFRRSACLKVRRKWRSDSGPVLLMPVYLSFQATIFSLPFGSMRGRASSSPRISASSSSETSTSTRCSPGRSPASPAPGWTSPCPSTSPTSPSPWATPPCCFSPNTKCGMSTDGSGMETAFLPLRATISPWLMYLRRFCLILPRMIWRNRRWSRSMRCDI